MTKQLNDSFSNHQLEQIRDVFNEGISALVVPQFDQVNNRLKKMDETLEDQTERLGRIEDRQQLDQGRLDNHDQRISVLEKAA